MNPEKLGLLLSQRVSQQHQSSDLANGQLPNTQKTSEVAHQQILDRFRFERRRLQVGEVCEAVAKSFGLKVITNQHDDGIKIPSVIESLGLRWLPGSGPAVFEKLTFYDKEPTNQSRNHFFLYFIVNEAGSVIRLQPRHPGIQYSSDKSDASSFEERTVNKEDWQNEEKLAEIFFNAFQPKPILSTLPVPEPYSNIDYGDAGGDD